MYWQASNEVLGASPGRELPSEAYSKGPQGIQLAHGLPPPRYKGPRSRAQIAQNSSSSSQEPWDPGPGQARPGWAGSCLGPGQEWAVQGSSVWVCKAALCSLLCLEHAENLNIFHHIKDPQTQTTIVTVAAAVATFEVLWIFMYLASILHVLYVFKYGHTEDRCNGHIRHKRHIILWSLR